MVKVTCGQLGTNNHTIIMMPVVRKIKSCVQNISLLSKLVETTFVFRLRAHKASFKHRARCMSDECPFDVVENSLFAVMLAEFIPVLEEALE